MSLKAELETWVAALEAYDATSYDVSLSVFAEIASIADSAKILFNMALINATVGEHHAAVELFNAATAKDRFMAIAYFQAGVSNYLLRRFEFALRDFQEALLYLRSNQDINYTQLGLAFRLHAAEVHFNIGLSLLAMGNRRDGLAELAEASRSKAVKEHGVIDECLRDEGKGYTVFSIPVGVIFRPPEAKLKNIKQKDYMGKARLVAASDERDAFTTFTGSTRLKLGQGPSGAALEGDRVAAMRLSEGEGGQTLMVRSSSDPGLPPKSPIRQAMREDAARRRDGTATEGTGVLAAAALNRSKSSAGGFKRDGGGGRQAGVEARAVEGRDGKARERGYAEDQVETLDADGDDNRVTGLYDDYYKLAAETPPALPAINSVQAWAATTRNAPPPPEVSISRSTSASTSDVKTPRSAALYSRSNSVSSTTNPPSSFKGQPQIRRAPSSGPARRSKQGSMRLLQRSTSANAAGRSPGYGQAGQITFDSAYDDDAFDDLDGYGSGEDGGGFEMTKVRLKIHYENDIRGLGLTPDMSYDEFVHRIATKFKLRGGQAQDVKIQFKDEEGSLVSMVDEDDFEAAIDVARANADGRPEGKLEVWIHTHD